MAYSLFMILLDSVQEQDALIAGVCPLTRVASVFSSPLDIVCDVIASLCQLMMTVIQEVH